MPPPPPPPAPQVRGHPPGGAAERQGEDQVKSHPQCRAGEVLRCHHQTPQTGEGRGGWSPKGGSPWLGGRVSSRAGALRCGGDIPCCPVSPPPRPTWRCSPRRAAARCGRWSAGFAAAATRTGPACSRSSGRPGETPRHRHRPRHPAVAGAGPGAALGGGGIWGRWDMGPVGPSFSLPRPGARLRTVCFLFPVGDSRFTLLLSLLAWLS